MPKTGKQTMQDDHVPKTEVVPGENDLVPGTGPPIAQVEAPVRDPGEPFLIPEMRKAKAKTKATNT